MYFYDFAIIFFTGKTVPFICKKLNSLYLRMRSWVKFGLMVLEKKIFKSRKSRNYLPLGKGGGPSFETRGQCSQTYGRMDDRQQMIRKAYLSFQLRWAKNFNALHPSMLYAKFLEFGPVVPEKKIFKSSQCISTISQLSLLWEKRGPLFDQIWIPFTQGCFMPRLVKFGQVVVQKIFRNLHSTLTISLICQAWSKALDLLL